MRKTQTMQNNEKVSGRSQQIQIDAFKNELDKVMEE